MSNSSALSQILLIVFSISSFLQLQFVHGDVGTATVYKVPYSPTACNGADEDQFPTSFMFAAVGEGIWNSGAACGRQYMVRCLSSRHPKTCSDKTIIVVVLDRASTAVTKPAVKGATMALTSQAFKAITKPSATANLVTIEYTEIH